MCHGMKERQRENRKKRFDHNWGGLTEYRNNEFIPILFK